MTTTLAKFLAIGLAVAAIGWSANHESGHNYPPDPAPIPRLVNTCVITNSLDRLVEFYELILMSKAKRSGLEYAEFATGVGVLAIFSERAQEKYIPGSTEAANNRSLILEFRVADVDQEYRRLQGLVKTWAKPPTTQPWGIRSTYFRDPDGNLVDLYAPVKSQ